MPVSVLIVDDHPSFRATARLLLESEGFEVVGEAADGASGLRQARELEPDLVLLDVQLPDIDGFEVRSPADRHRRRAGGRAHLEPATRPTSARS
jgi:DNA-binding NarL/FixJ family response regulator